MATKKVIKKDSDETTKETIKEVSVEAQILVELRKQTEYLDRLDFKFWKIAEIVEHVARDHGYVFRVSNEGVQFDIE